MLVAPFTMVVTPTYGRDILFREKDDEHHVGVNLPHNILGRAMIHVA